MYSVRTSEGMLVSRLNNRLAGRLINSTKGDWKPASKKGSGGVLIYVIDEDGYTIGNNDIAVVTWKGFYLIEEK